MAHRIFVVEYGIFSLQRLGSSLVAGCRVSSCGAQALERTSSVVVARGLSCPAACGILVP